jgi:tetratricopeptide (TPR) repeat protein
MTRTTGIAALALAAGLIAGALPASAQYANEFTPAKLLKQGKTSQPIAGTGTVVVQVQVNPDGTHKAIKVIKTTNAGDNDAAMEIAQSSTYRPAHRGSTPVPAFYDFTLRFTGKSVASSQSGGPAMSSVSSAAQQVATLIRAGQYSAAKSKAQGLLLSNPGDESLRQMLGIAAFDSGDVTTAAQAFDRVGSIGKQFQPAAAASFAAAAVQVSDSNPAQAMTYAQKAMSIDPSTNSKFALGVAQLANKQNAEALATLKSVQASAMNDPKFSKTVKENIDARLMEAYLLNNDNQDAQQVAAQIKQLDPNSTLVGRMMGNSYLKAGSDAATAKNYPEALKNFDLASQQGDPEVAVTADVQAAFVIAKMEKPDWKQMQSYADKALALKPDDPYANYAEGIAQAQLAAQNRDDSLKKKAVDSLNKADTMAKQAGLTSLSLQIESFLKSLNGPPSGGGQ